ARTGAHGQASAGSPWRNGGTTERRADRRLAIRLRCRGSVAAHGAHARPPPRGGPILGSILDVEQRGRAMSGGVLDGGEEGVARHIVGDDILRLTALLLMFYAGSGWLLAIPLKIACGAALFSD